VLANYLPTSNHLFVTSRGAKHMWIETLLVFRDGYKNGCYRSGLNIPDRIDLNYGQELRCTHD